MEAGRMGLDSVDCADQLAADMVKGRSWFMEEMERLHDKYLAEIRDAIGHFQDQAETRSDKFAQMWQDTIQRIDMSKAEYMRLAGVQDAGGSGYGVEGEGDVHSESGSHCSDLSCQGTQPRRHSSGRDAYV